MCLPLTSLTAVSCQSYAFYTFYHTWIEVSIPTLAHLTHYLINNQETSAMQRLPDLTKILISVATNGLGSCMPSIYPTSCSSGLRSYGRSFQHIPTLPFSAFGKFPLPIILLFQLLSIICLAGVQLQCVVVQSTLSLSSSQLGRYWVSLKLSSAAVRHTSSLCSIKDKN